MNKTVIVLLCLIPALLSAADSDDKLAQQRKLESLRREIDAVERLMVETSLREQALSDLLANLEHKISLRKQLLTELERGRKMIEGELRVSQRQLGEIRKDVGKAEDDIAFLEAEIAGLRKIVAARAVFVYKFWRWEEIRLILSSQDFNQVLTRKKYFNIIARRDMRNLELLKDKNQRLNTFKTEKLSSEERLREAQKNINHRLQQKSRVIEEEKQEEAKLQKDKKEKTDLLTRVKGDRSVLRQQLEEKKLAALEIERMISSLERTKEAAQEVARMFPDLEFDKLKGKLEWPAEGKIVSQFGNQMNPKLKTWTENTGIDIEAKPGSPVYAVAAGKVTVGTWMRGYGTTLIVSHPGGFYTVYTHLDDILVNIGAIVKAGTVIATVGDSGSLEGARLHFEVWERKVKHDPEIWLKKRG